MSRVWTTVVAYEEAVDPQYFVPIDGIGQWGKTLIDGRVEWRSNADEPWRTLEPAEAQRQYQREMAIAEAYRAAMVPPTRGGER